MVRPLRLLGSAAPVAPHWPSVALSVVLHGAALALVLALIRFPLPEEAPSSPAAVTLVELPPLAPARRPAPTEVRVPERSRGDAARAASGPAIRAAAIAVARGGVDTGVVRLPDEPSVRRVGAAYSTGKLWVRPLPLPPAELAARASRSREQLLDSAVTAVIQSFLDSIAADPSSRAAVPPEWTTTVAGSKFGLDSRWIYLAGLKIPTVLLALLPLPAGGNEQKAFDRSSWLYADLRYAAQRSANLAEFKQTIREIRERKEAEREFERNQRSDPPRGSEPSLQPLAP